ncbi:hypothetical protein BDZ89DRAFT_1133503 [Hymenopellis radicata]|nr:hypothetical protein BDZ89DRAFT_1133503 [Hymenopellis radicata]
MIILAPVAELFYDSGYPRALGIVLWQLLPFSRGSVQITSSDPFTQPAINVNYFSVDWDLDRSLDWRSDPWLNCRRF